MNTQNISVKICDDKKLLEKGKEKYAYEIVELARQISEQ